MYLSQTAKYIFLQISKYICFKLQNIFVSNCKMCLSQIAKCICLKLQNVLVSRCNEQGLSNRGREGNERDPPIQTFRNGSSSGKMQRIASHSDNFYWKINICNFYHKNGSHVPVRCCQTKACVNSKQISLTSFFHGPCQYLSINYNHHYPNHPWLDSNPEETDGQTSESARLRRLSLSSLREDYHQIIITDGRLSSQREDYHQIIITEGK